ncbi:hypothetical protein DXG01_007839 [Tephrocybe rancida]|nr:hypothetical protein DXG01_007839 [Tephrocybe rancida]
MPRYAHTNIGDSEYPGGMKTYCSPAGRYSSQQGQLPAQFWRNVEFKTGKGKNGGRYAQREPIPHIYNMLEMLRPVSVTGCINPSLLSRLNPNDGGGQYDSSGGAGGNGNPAGSKCLGYVLEFSRPRDTGVDAVTIDITITLSSLSLQAHAHASNAVTTPLIAQQIKTRKGARMSFQEITSTVISATGLSVLSGLLLGRLNFKLYGHGTLLRH